MYNTQFRVKYNIIERELLSKLRNKETKTQENQKEDDNTKVNDNTTEEDEYDYNEQDVLDICDKIYRDELLSVFRAEDLEDLIIGEIMNNVYNEIIKNPKFDEFIFEIETMYFKEFIENENNKHRRKNLKQIILTSFFSQKLFHLVHKCICQQLETLMIDDNLLNELKEQAFKLFDKEFVDLFEKEFT
jgi:hypothetical protein